VINSGSVSQKNSNNFIFYGFLLLYAGILIYLSSRMNIWVDETYTLNTTSNNLNKVISQSYGFEGQPPVYFILLSFWRKINSSIFFARSFSLAFIALAAYFFYQLCCLITAKTSSRWLVVVFLLNPFTVWAAMEIRLYAFLLFLSVAAIYFFFNFYNSNKMKYLYLLIGTCLIGMYTQYFFAFLIAGFAASLLLFNGWKVFFRFCLYMLPVVLLFVPSLFFTPVLTKYVQTLVVHSAANQIFGLLQSTQNLLFASQLIPFERWVKLFVKIPFIIMLIYSYYKLYKQNKNGNYFKNINKILVMNVVFVILLCCFFGLTRVDYQYRYLTILMPLSLLLFSTFEIYDLFRRRLIYGIISIFYGALLISNYWYPVKEFDYERIAKYVETVERKNEPVLFYHSTISLSFNYYYQGKNPLVPIPHEVRFDSTTYASDIKDTIELKRSIEKVSTTSGSYLLVSDLTEKQSIGNPNQKMVNDYLAAHYNISLDTLYFGRSKDYSFRIRRLEKK
jgi:uncharacterized membrane protein